ncbi:unnamed protein product, partial [Amoebophrya sp. A25]
TRASYGQRVENGARGGACFTARRRLLVACSCYHLRNRVRLFSLSLAHSPRGPSFFRSLSHGNTSRPFALPTKTSSRLRSFLSLFQPIKSTRGPSLFPFCSLSHFYRYDEHTGAATARQ